MREHTHSSQRDFSKPQVQSCNCFSLCVKQRPESFQEARMACTLGGTLCPTPSLLLGSCCPDPSLSNHTQLQELFADHPEKVKCLIICFPRGHILHSQHYLNCNFSIQLIIWLEPTALQNRSSMSTETTALLPVCVDLAPPIESGYRGVKHTSGEWVNTRTKSRLSPFPLTFL